MKRLLRTIGLIVSLMMLCVGMASAGNDTHDHDLEKQTGYISLEKINNHPERFIPLKIDDTTIMYIDTDSIKVLRDDSKYRELEFKVFTVNHDKSPAIYLRDVIAIFDMQDRETLATKTDYMSIYDFDGKYIRGEEMFTTFDIAPMWTPPYIISTGAYGFVFKEAFSEKFRKLIVKAMEEEGL